MKKALKWISISLFSLWTLIILAGIYKFNYLSSQKGYDVDGNKVSTIPTNIEEAKITEYLGNYVTPDYQKRNEGYDWVVVSVVKLSDSTIHVSVRSRADRKKTTCTFDADARKISRNAFKSLSDKEVNFTFRDNGIIISSEKKEDEIKSSYYCSGGGSLVGFYTKINEPLGENKLIEQTK